MSKLKSKTHKGIAARFKVTGTGKLMKRVPGKGHLLSKKSSHTKMKLRKDRLMSPAETSRYKKILGFKID